MAIESDVLEKIGLSTTEAKVYLACLELVNDTVLNIAKKANVKRPTCYLTLDGLTQKGYVTKIEKKNTRLYTAAKPTFLLRKYQENMDNFHDFLPFFEAKFNRGPKPKIRYYEGKNELWDVYTKILFPSNELYFFGSDIEKISKVFTNLFDYWNEKYYRQHKKTMEIVSFNQGGVDYIKKYGAARPIKLMPRNLPVFADTVITEDKLFIVSMEHLFGVLIESTDLAKTYVNFFLLAWQAADKLVK